MNVSAGVTRAGVQGCQICSPFSWLVGKSGAGCSAFDDAVGMRFLLTAPRKYITCGEERHANERGLNIFSPIAPNLITADFPRESGGAIQTGITQ